MFIKVMLKISIYRHEAKAQVSRMQETKGLTECTRNVNAWKVWGCAYLQLTKNTVTYTKIENWINAIKVQSMIWISLWSFMILQIKIGYMQFRIFYLYLRELLLLLTVLFDLQIYESQIKISIKKIKWEGYWRIYLWIYLTICNQ